MDRQAQRQGRKGKNAVRRDAHHLLERELGFAGKAGRPSKEDRLLPKTGPRHHAADETVAFRHGEKGVDHPAVQQPEITGVERNGDVGDAVEEAVERPGPPGLEPRLPLAHGANAVGDVRPSTPAVEHFEDDLGRILQVRVGEDDGVAPGGLQAGGVGDLLTEVAGQGEDPHALVGALEFPQDVQRGVVAAVVDVNDLEVEFRNLLEGGDEAAVHLGDDRRFVETGHDHGQFAPAAPPGLDVRVALRCRHRLLARAFRPAARMVSIPRSGDVPVRPGPRGPACRSANRRRARTATRTPRRTAPHVRGTTSACR